MNRMLNGVVSPALAIVLGVGILTTSLQAYPRPAPVSSRPEFDFEPIAMRLYSTVGGGQYWYLIYDVVNRTGQDRTWAPMMVLYTDRGEVLRDGESVPRSVVASIISHIGDPLIEPRSTLIGRLRQGEGHARRGIAIWPAHRKDVNELRLFVSGMSPETAVVSNPITGEPVTLRKNLYLHYLVPGDPMTIGDQPVELHPRYGAEVHWVFR